MLECPTSVQRWLAISICIKVALIWYSYDAAVLTLPEHHHQLDQLSLKDQQFTLTLVLTNFFVCTIHPISFYNTLLFIGTAAILAWLVYCDFTAMYISNVGIVTFMFTWVLVSTLAHEDEQTSRARFKSNVRVHKIEKQVADVLDTLLPPLIVKELRSQTALAGNLPSHEFKKATITQSDLAGFTQLSATKQPHEVVGFMGDLFGAFDRLADVFKVYKIETIGDAYIAGMAEQPLTETNSVVAVVKFGLAMIQATKKWADNLQVEVICRVGVHHGECVGGIVGTGMMRYHLFGQFMGVVDTLEATSKLGVCQISGACKKAIEEELAEQNRLLTDEPHLKLNSRDGEQLTTSKGEVHELSEVGGQTFLIYPPDENLEEAEKRREAGSATEQAAVSPPLSPLQKEPVVEGSATAGASSPAAPSSPAVPSAEPTTEAPQARKKMEYGALDDETVQKVRSTVKAVDPAVTNGENLETLFSSFDPDSSGSLAPDEVREAFRTSLKISAEQVSDADIQALCGMLDADKTGTVSISELVACLGDESAS